MKKILPALPLMAAFAALFTVPAFADVVFFPREVRIALVTAAIALVLFCVSAVVVLVIFLTRKKVKKNRETEK